MSASRVEGADDMAVDDSGVDPPTNEWLQRAQRATETLGGQAVGRRVAAYHLLEAAEGRGARRALCEGAGHGGDEVCDEARCGAGGGRVCVRDWSVFFGGMDEDVGGICVRVISVYM